MVAVARSRSHPSQSHPIATRSPTPLPTRIKHRPNRTLLEAIRPDDHPEYSSACMAAGRVVLQCLFTPPAEKRIKVAVAPVQAVPEM